MWLTTDGGEKQNQQLSLLKTLGFACSEQHASLLHSFGSQLQRLSVGLGSGNVEENEHLAFAQCSTLVDQVVPYEQPPSKSLRTTVAPAVLKLSL
jgi:hypothetical protein